MRFARQHAARLFGILNIVGDVFIFMSGGAYGSLFRQLAATSGIIANLLMVRFGDNKTPHAPLSLSDYMFRWKRPHDHAVDIGMSLIFISGLCYMISGVVQFDVEGRPQESLMGIFICLGTSCMIFRKPVLGSSFFLATTMTSLTMPFLLKDVIARWDTEGMAAFSSLTKDVTLDPYVMAAVGCFLGANWMARYIGHKTKQKQ